MKRELIECLCNECSINHQVYYDARNDYYICRDCLDSEEENEEDDEYQKEQQSEYDKDLQRDEEIYRIQGDN